MKILLLLLSFLLSSCGKPPYLNKSTKTINETNSSRYFEINNLLVELDWKTPLSISQESIATMTITKHSAPHALPAHSEIFLWMASMGHGSADITIKEIAHGVYELRDIYFYMNGDWQLHIDIPINSQQSESHIFEYFL